MAPRLKKKKKKKKEIEEGKKRKKKGCNVISAAHGSADMQPVATRNEFRRRGPAGLTIGQREVSRGSQGTGSFV